MLDKQGNKIGADVVLEVLHAFRKQLSDNILEVIRKRDKNFKEEDMELISMGRIESDDSHYFGYDIGDEIDDFITALEKEDFEIIYMSGSDNNVWEINKYDGGVMKCNCPVYKFKHNCHHVETLKLQEDDKKPIIIFSDVASVSYDRGKNIITAPHISYMLQGNSISSQAIPVLSLMLLHGYSIGDIKTKFEHRLGKKWASGDLFYEITNIRS